MKNTIEKRLAPKDELRVVAETSDSQPKIEGYAAVFNSDSVDMGFIERIAPGAFKSALKNADVRALINHDPNEIVGRTGQNLTLSEDEKGLKIEMSRPKGDSKRYEQLLADIESGFISQQSFAFTIEKESWEGIEEDTPTRTINKVGMLTDTSFVTYPAYPDTSVALRSLELARDEKSTNELRDKSSPPTADASRDASPSTAAPQPTKEDFINHIKNITRGV